jgi:probable HAF family extracellular repeat protein
MYSFVTLPVAPASLINNNDEESSASGINNNDDIIFTTPVDTGAPSYFSSAVGNFIKVANLNLGVSGQVLGINDADHLVGYIKEGEIGFQGFVYADGTTTIIQDPTDNNNIFGTMILGINDAGQMIGINGAGNLPDNSFLYKNGVFTYFSDGFQATGINNEGEVVGTLIDSSGVQHGAVYNGTTYTTFDDPSAAAGETQPTGINNSGQIVGDYFDGNGVQHGFLYSNGTFTTIDDPLGSKGTVITGINDQGQIVGSYSDASGLYGFFADTSTISTVAVQLDYLAMTRTGLPLDQATSIANSIDAGSTTEFAFMNSLFVQVADTTVPAVAVEASMYGAVGSSAEITLLATQFLPAQVAYAIQTGYDPLVFACQTLGLVFAFGNEAGNTGFANNYGPSNAAMPNNSAGDATFAVAATNAIFGSTQTANTAPAILGYVHFLEGFFTANGVVGVANPTADQIVIAARAGAWGDAVAIALENPTLAPLAGQTINFLDNAAQGTAIYSAPFSSQPTPLPFQGQDTSATTSDAQLIGVGAPTDHVHFQ